MRSAIWAAIDLLLDVRRSSFVHDHRLREATSLASRY
jgi:hypothetical protein